MARTMRGYLVLITLVSLLGPPLVAQEPTELTAPQQLLMEAAFNGQLDLVERLVAGGTDPDFADPERRTPLMVAAFNGHAAVLAYLLQAGVEVDARDANGRTALMYASSGPFLEAVELLLDSGAAVNARGTLEGFTALMTAASEGLLDIVRLLLERGADPALVDKDGDTALSFARQNGHQAVVEVLENAPPAADESG